MADVAKAKGSKAPAAGPHMLQKGAKGGKLTTLDKVWRCPQGDLHEYSP